MMKRKLRYTTIRAQQDCYGVIKVKLCRVFGVRETSTSGSSSQVLYIFVDILTTQGDNKGRAVVVT